MIPNTNDLLIFLSVAETGSLTAAAAQTRVTKSAVSQALKRTEDAVGQRLLFRTTRSMSLTEAGMRLLPLCRQLRTARDDITSAIDTLSGGASQTLCITAPHALCQALLIPLLAEIPELAAVHIRLIAEDAALDLVQHQIDLAFRVGAPAPNSAMISKVGVLKESLWASHDLLQRKAGLPDRLSDLADWPHVASDWQGNPLSYSLPDGGALQITPGLRCNTVIHVQDFVARGCGVGLLPDLLAGSDPRLARVTEISETPIYALHQHGKNLPKALQTLVKAARIALRDN